MVFRAWVRWGLMGLASASVAAPYRPADPNLELAHGLSPYRATLASGAPSLDAALTEARSLIDEGRRRADVRAFAYADKLLAPYLGQVGSHADLALVLADIHQYRHDFDGAAAVLDDLLKHQPQNDTARLMRAEIRLAQGRGREALRDCLVLVGRQSPWIWSACSAQAYAINGRLSAAQQLLATTLKDLPIDGSQGAWAAGIMAELYAQAGDLAQSEAWLKRALKASPDDHVAAVQLLDLWIASGNSDLALRLLQSRPPSDAYLIRKAEALGATDPAASGLIVADLRRRFAEADTLGDRTHLRERALFELRFGDPRTALDFARENFRTQRELADARIVLDAAATLNDPGGAAEVVAWLRDTHTSDARLTSALGTLGIQT